MSIIETGQRIVASSSTGVIACVLLMTFADVTVAAASCDQRPGTPNNVRARTVSPTAIVVSWRNTTGKPGILGIRAERYLFFDTYLRQGNDQPTGRDRTGWGPLKVRYGDYTTLGFSDLTPRTKYCFALRARTEGGTQGCVSAQTSNWGCTVTR